MKSQGATRTPPDFTAGDIVRFDRGVGRVVTQAPPTLATPWVYYVEEFDIELIGMYYGQDLELLRFGFYLEA